MKEKGPADKSQLLNTLLRMVRADNRSFHYRIKAESTAKAILKAEGWPTR